MKNKILAIICVFIIFTQQVSASVLGEEILGWSHDIAKGTEIYKNVHRITRIFQGGKIVEDIKEIKDLLGGLEKYGLDEETLQRAFDETSKQIKTKTVVKETKATELSEEDFILLKQQCVQSVIMFSVQWR